MVLKLLRVSRPHFLIASLTLFTLGACWAILHGAPLAWPRLLLGYLIVLPAHISVSYSNDSFDVEADRHGSPTLFSGGSGMLVHFAELRRPALWIAVLLIACSLVVAVIFTLRYTYPPWFLGFVLFTDLLGWFYSAPPVRLAYRGLGEITTLLTAGVLLPGMGYLTARGTLDRAALPLALPLMIYGLAFILSVEIPDVEADRLGGKHTWVSRLGRRTAFEMVALLYLAAGATFFIDAWPTQANMRIIGLFSMLPFAAALVGAIRRPEVRSEATPLVNLSLISLALFLFLADGVLIAAVMKLNR